MSLQIGFVAELIAAEAWGLDDVLEHASHVLIDILDVELAALHTFDDVFCLCGIAWRHQVVACLYLVDGVETLSFALVDPVGHHDAAEAPVGAEDICEQAFAALCELSVHQIVG